MVPRKVRAVTTAIAVALLAAFVAIERRLRIGTAALSLETGAADRGTTRIIGAAFTLSLFAVAASVFLDRAGILLLGEPIGWLGVLVMLAGIGLRIWAARVLGSSYTRTLRAAAGQRLVREGPYRLIRHPGYAGSIAMWIGAGLATRNIAVVLFIAVVMALAYGARIAAEERMLAAVFAGDYRDYARRSWRLVPLIY
jgi:protein-S-isoprenylcysteine O-methyltransferase Ste14